MKRVYPFLDVRTGFGLKREVGAMIRYKFWAYVWDRGISEYGI